MTTTDNQPITQNRLLKPILSFDASGMSKQDSLQPQRHCQGWHQFAENAMHIAEIALTLQQMHGGDRCFTTDV